MTTTAPTAAAHADWCNNHLPSDDPSRNDCQHTTRAGRLEVSVTIDGGISPYWEHSTSDLSAAEAREYAGLILRAAERLEDLQGGSRHVDGVVRAMRDALGLTVEQAAERAGMTAERLTEIESGAPATNAECQRIAAVMADGLGR